MKMFRQFFGDFCRAAFSRQIESRDGRVSDELENEFQHFQIVERRDVVVADRDDVIHNIATCDVFDVDVDVFCF